MSAPGWAAGSGDVFPDVTAVGVDGCRAGWVAVFHEGTGLRARVCSRLEDLLAAFPDLHHVLLDMPIGLPGRACPDRRCDRVARRCLRGQASSVFSPPSRPALGGATHPEASKRNRCEIGKGLSIQAFNITPKIRAVDELLQDHPEWQHRIFESHPEVCFKALNEGHPLSGRKSTRSGQEERLALLERYLPGVMKDFVAGSDRLPRGMVKADDLLDAAVLWFVASRPRQEWRTLPPPSPSRPGPPLDDCGLPMRIVYWRARRDARGHRVAQAAAQRR